MKILIGTNNPGKIDVSVSGHVKPHETAIQAIPTEIPAAIYLAVLADDSAVASVPSANRPTHANKSIKVVITKNLRFI